MHEWLLGVVLYFSYNQQTNKTKQKKNEAQIWNCIFIRHVSSTDGSSDGLLVQHFGPDWNI